MAEKELTIHEQFNQETFEPIINVYLDFKRVTSLSKFDPKLIDMFGTSAIDECEQAARRELKYWGLSEDQIAEVLAVVMEKAPKQQPVQIAKTYTPIPKPTNKIERELQELGLTVQQYDRILKIISKYNLME